MVEEEQKYEVDDAYVLPDLAGTAPAGGRVRALPPVTLSPATSTRSTCGWPGPVPRCATAGATSCPGR